MTNVTMPTERVGQSKAPQGSERSHTLIVLANDSHGALDRIIGVLRRRRANIQAIAIGRNEQPNMMRITVVTDDSEVEVGQLIEQLRKIFEVRQVVNLLSEQAIARELALVKMNSTPENYREIMETGHLFGAHVVDITQETITLEVTGSAEKVEKLMSLLQSYGIREVARTGYVAMACGAGDNDIEKNKE